MKKTKHTFLFLLLVILCCNEGLLAHGQQHHQPYPASNDSVPAQTEATHEKVYASVNTAIGVMIGFRLNAISSTAFAVMLIILLAVLSTILYAHAPHIIKITIPQSAALIIVGCVLGAVVEVTNFSNFNNLFNFNQDIFFLLLIPPIVLHSGYFTHKDFFFNNLYLILVYAFIGTAFAALMTGFSLYGIQVGGLMMLGESFTLVDLLLFGSLIAAVDPVSVMAIFEELEVNRRLNIWVFGESELNDAVCVVLYGLFVSMKESTEHTSDTGTIVGLAIAKVLLSATVSLIIGLLCGFIGSFLTRFTGRIPVVEPLIVGLFSALSFFVADSLYLSGVVAIMFCAMFMSYFAEMNVAWQSHITIRNGLLMIASVAENVIFIYLGISLVAHNHLFDWVLIAFTILFITAYRFIFLYGVAVVKNLFTRKSIHKIPWREQFMVAYGGLRGGFAFALAYLISPVNFARERDIIITTTLFVILFTTFVQGTTIRPLLKLLKIQLIDKEFKPLKFKIRPEQMKFVLRKYQAKLFKDLVYYHDHPEMIQPVQVSKETLTSASISSRASASSSDTAEEVFPTVAPRPLEQLFDSLNGSEKEDYEPISYEQLREMVKETNQYLVLEFKWYMKKIQAIHREYDFSKSSTIAENQIVMSEKLRQHMSEYIRDKGLEKSCTALVALTQQVFDTFHYLLAVYYRRKHIRMMKKKANKHTTFPLAFEAPDNTIMRMLIQHRAVEHFERFEVTSGLSTQLPSEIRLTKETESAEFLNYLACCLLLELLKPFFKRVQKIASADEEEINCITAVPSGLADAASQVLKFVTLAGNYSAAFANVKRGKNTSKPVEALGGKLESKEVTEAVFSLMCIKVMSIVRDMIVEKKSVSQKATEAVTNTLRKIIVRPLTTDEHNAIHALHLLQHAEYNVYEVKLRRAREDVISFERKLRHHQITAAGAHPSSNELVLTQHQEHNDLEFEKERRRLQETLSDLKSQYYIFRRQQIYALLLLQKYQTGRSINIFRVFQDGGFYATFDSIYAKVLLVILEGRVSRKALEEQFSTIYQMEEFVSAPIIWKTQTRKYNASFDTEEEEGNILKSVNSYIQRLTTMQNNQQEQDKVLMDFVTQDF